MRKIVRQQNYLKELIESQGNKRLSAQALDCLVRSILEPLLNAPEDGVVLYRMDNKPQLNGILKRLEFSDIKSINYSDESENLKEKVWANTNFACVLTHRFVAIIIWEINPKDKDYVKYYSLYNSKLQYEPLDIINRNSTVNISEYMEKYKPDRRDNILLNSSVRKLLENLEEAANDAVLGYAEQNAGATVVTDYAIEKNRVISHEIKNQVSVCDLYTEIIKRHLQKPSVKQDDIQRAVDSICKALKMINGSLMALKTDDKAEMKDVIFNEVINTAVELSCVYAESKNIDLQVDNVVLDEVSIAADFDKLVAVIINLVKNASEAFEIEQSDEKNCAETNGKYIKIKTEMIGDIVQISISNNAIGIENPEKIFEYGFSTKSKGNGLGLWICRKYIEEQSGKLILARTTENFTEFIIEMKVGG